MTPTLRFEADAAILTFDNPPLNVLSQSVRQAFSDALDEVAASDARRLILTGAGRAFVAGADAREFDGPALEPHLNEILARLAAFPIPTVAAINGTALGGGLEIALACRYRIASPAATLGLPEVTLGIVPGAGGTQRLPRLIGIGAALDLIATGKPVTGSKALALGLVDETAEDPLAAALALPGDTLAACPAPDTRPAPVADPEAVAAAQKTAARRLRGQDAPQRAIALVAASAEQPLPEALAAERAAFLALRVSDQARALRHVFFSERAARAQGKAHPAPATGIRTALVAGGGSMGAAIAYAFASHGIATTVIEMDAAGRNRAEANTRALVDGALKRGLIPQQTADDISGRLSHAVGYDALPRAHLAIEAVFENIGVKRKVLAALEAALPAEAILATNTSYLDVNALAADLARPERFLGLHFFSPAHIMTLLEIVRGDTTAPETLGAGLALAKVLGKLPVISGVCDGFIGNRILTRYRHAADILLVEGCLPAEVDAAMEAFGMPMGPYTAQDMSGLDIAYANRQRQDLRNRAGYRYVPLTDTLVEDHKRLGRKTGAGWYDYPDGKTPVPAPLVETLVRAASEGARITRRSFCPEEISERIVTAMICEACDILEEGIAQAPRDIDLVEIHGYGFPRWRGGLMHHADRVGVPALIARIEAFAAGDPLSWSVPPLLQRLQQEGRRLSDLDPG